MKIKCPDCKTAYDIKPEILGEEGRSVKCARCGNRWFVSPKKANEDLDLEADSPPADADTADEAHWMEDEADEQRAAEEKGFAAEAADDEDDDLDSVTSGDAFSEEDEDEEEEEKEPAASTPAPAPRATLASEDDDDYDEEDEDDTGDPSKRPADIETLAKRPKIIVNPNKFKRSVVGAVLKWLARRNYRRIAGIGLFGGALAICAFLVLIRDQIVRDAPDLASLFEFVGLEVNLRGLEFRDLRTFSEVAEGKQVLVVEGTIRNIGEEQTPVPAVRLSIRGTDLQEIYAWTVEPRTTMLKGLDETRFRTILSNPPDGASDILVRFIDRGRKQVILE
ncbi:zinc-ribbon domain-containing protein [Roseibium aggregatum]|uniref:Thioredoxin n=1 Tax=Roseibium aggregatum TaxID=187304 RepID=A0A926S6G7_9HYPH|nr:zinc-ribbon domain-containing protein [Roseibium aggregatum]MBD1546472.1 thioredoxin [Roseibium aggregatum]